MIKFDEKGFAEKMHDTQSFINMFSRTELLIYAKWLRYNKIIELEKDYTNLTPDEILKIDKYVEHQLIDFSERNYPNFNYVLHYSDIDYAVEKSKYYKLKLPTPIPITENEWNTILSVENDNYRRILFVMLVDAKYYRLNNTSIYKECEINDDTVFYTQMTDNETIKLAKVKLDSKNEKRYIWNYFYTHGLADITYGRNNVRFVKFVDINTESNILDYITDYDHLNLHFDRLMGEKIGVCKYCSKLFKKRHNDAKYCYVHRGYNKKKSFTIKCTNCGREFPASGNTKRTLCDICYKQKRYFDKNKNRLGVTII